MAGGRADAAAVAVVLSLPLSPPLFPPCPSPRWLVRPVVALDPPLDGALCVVAPPPESPPRLRALAGDGRGDAEAPAVNPRCTARAVAGLRGDMAGAGDADPGVDSKDRRAGLRRDEPEPVDTDVDADTGGGGRMGVTVVANRAAAEPSLAAAPLRELPALPWASDVVPLLLR